MELSSPITIHWDLPQGGGDSDTLRHTCADILSCRPLMLQVRDLSPALSQESLELLALLKGSPLAVSFTAALTALTPRLLTHICTLAPKEILLFTDSVGELRDWLEGQGTLPSSPTVGVSFSVTAANWRELPELLRLLRERGMKRLILPMQRTFRREPPFLLVPQEQEFLARALAEGKGCDGVELTIHDPFLWRAFNPGVPFPQGGCQAANTMLAVAPDLGVYPCPTLPWRLGSLAESSLKEIIASSAKKEFRRTLLAHPAGCLRCEEVSVCKGGCRGRAYIVHDHLEGADPACGIECPASPRDLELIPTGEKTFAIGT